MGRVRRIDTAPVNDLYGPETPQRPLDVSRLRYDFAGRDRLTYRYSQADQDIFVLTATGGLRAGKYLEIGCAWPFYINNTALLETQFDWSGVSIDTSPCYTDTWPNLRQGAVVTADARDLDLVDLLKQYCIDGPDLDYLSIDCDPAPQSLSVLRCVPFDSLRFAVITFEHDAYCSDLEVRNQSRYILQSHGYQLLVPSVTAWPTGPADQGFEDWWVHPDLVPQGRRQILRSTKASNYYLEYLYH